VSSVPAGTSRRSSRAYFDQKSGVGIRRPSIAHYFNGLIRRDELASLLRDSVTGTRAKNPSSTYLGIALTKPRRL